MKFIEYGKKDDDTIILLHGAGLSWWNYRREAELLANRFHVILPILDGHGGSDRSFTSIKSAALEIIDFIDTCCGGSVLAIGGLSLGGQILLEIAARRNRISRDGSQSFRQKRLGYLQTCSMSIMVQLSR